jgi:hypothetical protein
MSRGYCPSGSALAPAQRMRRTLLLAILFLLGVAGSTPGFAQGLDVTLFAGRAYPVFDDRLTLRPGAPAAAGLDVTVVGAPEIRADGGLVFGGAAAFELGIVGIEGRLDATNVAFDVTGARYDLRGTVAPFEDVTGSITIGDGRLQASRMHLLSLNLRVRTPGAVGLQASGGLSYLPDVSVTGSVPLGLQLPGFISVPGVEPRLRLEAVPDEPANRIGGNVGVGLRAGGPRLALLAEVRGFFFRAYALRFGVDGAPGIANEIVRSIDTIRFEPVIVNAQAGLIFRF